MEIKTKFNIGDTVWFIGEYRIESAKVEKIEIRSERAMNDLPYDKRPVYTNVAYTLAYQHGTIHEKRLFATKEDLIASL